MNRRRNSQTICPKVGMMPQRCFLRPIPNRVTASVQAALQNVTKVPLLLHLGP